MLTVRIDSDEELDLDFYFKALAHLAVGDDGLVDEHERAFIQAQADIYSIDPAPYLESELAWEEIELQTVQPSRETALAVVRDGIALGYINGSITEGQRRILYRVAARLGLNAEDVDAVEEWLMEYWAVLERGNQLLREE